jgi:hypothetical protein
MPKLIHEPALLLQILQINVFDFTMNAQKTDRTLYLSNDATVFSRP